ncbi:MAG: DUF721 domain-containing protein [Nitrospirota bacterium]
MKKVDSLLIPIIRNLGINEGLRLAEIKKNWYELFNEPLSSHISPLKLSQGKILLQVDSPVWLQELNFYEEELIKKLSPHGVKAVRFRLGRVPTKARGKLKGQYHTKSIVKSLTKEELTFIEDRVSRIKDPDLRVRIKRAMEKSIQHETPKIPSTKF